MSSSTPASSSSSSQTREKRHKPSSPDNENQRVWVPNTEFKKADYVPTDADLEKLKRVSEEIEKAKSGRFDDEKDGFRFIEVELNQFKLSIKRDWKLLARYKTMLCSAGWLVKFYKRKMYYTDYTGESQLDQLNEETICLKKDYIGVFRLLDSCPNCAIHTAFRSASAQ